jgi:prepilin-type N-terminal cleavage/methylation domain-containing protein
MSDLKVMGTKRGFSLMEILIVIGIIAILGAVIYAPLKSARDKAYVGRSKMEFNSLNNALELYKIDHGDYPADVNRGLPNGLEAYLAGENWPSAPWPGTVYDWDNWEDPESSGERIIQFSIRFCDIGETDPANCLFPQEGWAENFDINSAVYYCVEGNCRSHIGQPVDYPGYCVNCGD